MIRMKLLVAVGFAALSLGLPLLAFADDIANNIDATVDTTLETMSLHVGGPAGSALFNVNTRNGDGRNGCNFGGGGSPTLVVAVSSSNPLVASVSPQSLTFTGCSNTPSVNVAPLAEGSTTITLSQTSNTTQGSFNLAPASFRVEVGPAPTSTPVPPTATPVPPTATAEPPTATPVPLPAIGGGGGGVIGGGGGTPNQTPELGSLALFGSGAAGMAGYALLRFRNRRRR